MFGFINKKIANPVGLDDSLFWLSSTIKGEQRKEAAKKVFGIISLALIKILTEGVDENVFIRRFKELSDKSMLPGNEGLTDRCVHYVCYAFISMRSVSDKHHDAIYNLSKIVAYIESNVGANAARVLSENCTKK